jgi:hypothetical protein
MYRIGIIINNKHVFSNGLMQNAYFLYEVYKQLGNICTLLSYDKDYKHLKGIESIPVKLVSVDPSEFLTSEYDVLITVGMGISRPVYESCKRTNTFVIGFVCGNMLANTTEGINTESDASGFIGKEAPVDKIWIIEGHRYMKTFTELIRGTSAVLVRHTWSPILLEMFANERRRTKDSLYYKHVHTPTSKFNLVILEPNIGYVKTAIIPFSICEYLNKTHTDRINQVFIFNWNDKSKTGTHLLETFDVSKKTRIFKSLLIDEILSHFNSLPEPFIVISHQINNPWNYLYYEMWHFGVPLVHNSPDFKQLGFYYSECNIDEGSAAVLNAMNYHTKLNTIQKPKIAKLLESMDPYNSECQTYWNGLLENEMFALLQNRIIKV